MDHFSRPVASHPSLREWWLFFPGHQPLQPGNHSPSARELRTLAPGNPHGRCPAGVEKRGRTNKGFLKPTGAQKKMEGSHAGN